jgi:hypothetical protein
VYAVRSYPTTKSANEKSPRKLALFLRAFQGDECATTLPARIDSRHKHRDKMVNGSLHSITREIKNSLKNFAKKNTTSFN